MTETMNKTMTEKITKMAMLRKTIKCLFLNLVKDKDTDKDNDRDNDMGQGGHTSFLPLHPRTSTWAALLYAMCSVTKSVTSESWVVS